MKRVDICFGRPALIALILSGLLLAASQSAADIYKFIDEDGVVHFTNVPTSSMYQKVPAYSRLFPTLSKKNTAVRNAAVRKTEHDYEPHILAVCLKHGLDHKLVKAVIKAESAFNPAAVSPKGAMGLMQLMPGTSRSLGVLDPFDPLQNIDGGVRYLKALLQRFRNNVVFALAAYNAGPEAVEKYGGLPPYDETLVYVQRVLKYYVRDMQ